MQAVLLQDAVWFSRRDALLGTDWRAFSAACTALRYPVAFLPHCVVAGPIPFPKDGVHAEIEIFDFHIPNSKYNADAPCIAWVEMGQVRLFPENEIDIVALFCFR